VKQRQPSITHVTAIDKEFRVIGGKQVTKSARKRPRKSASNEAVETATEKTICFVIMPFGGWLDDYYETIYCPAIKAAGLEAHRADDLYRPSTIVNDIWIYTRRAKLLLADLTGKNPNVFYELGLAHALAKPAILVSESMDDIPFDLRALRIIVYDKNDPRWGELLQQKVQAAIKEVLKAPQEAVLPAFLHVRDSAGAVSVTPHEKELIEIKQELDLLRREVRRGALTPGAGRPLREIEPDEARERVRMLVRRGVPDKMIVRELEPLGPPEGWILQRIREFKERRRPAQEPKRPIKPIAAEPTDATRKTISEA
jgi:hypothetical protein